MNNERRIKKRIKRTCKKASCKAKWISIFKSFYFFLFRGNTLRGMIKNFRNITSGRPYYTLDSLLGKDLWKKISFFKWCGITNRNFVENLSRNFPITFFCEEALFKGVHDNLFEWMWENIESNLLPHPSGEGTKVWYLQNVQNVMNQ